MKITLFRFRTTTDWRGSEKGRIAGHFPGSWCLFPRYLLSLFVLVFSETSFLMLPIHPPPPRLSSSTAPVAGPEESTQLRVYKALKHESSQESQNNRRNTMLPTLASLRRFSSPFDLSGSKPKRLQLQREKRNSGRFFPSKIRQHLTFDGIRSPTFCWQNRIEKQRVNLRKLKPPKQNPFVTASYKQSWLSKASSTTAAAAFIEL